MCHLGGWNNEIWKITMILLFSVLCVLLSNDSSAWSKNWKSQQNSWNFSDQKSSGKIVKPKRYLKNFPLQKNRIWPNFRPKNIGRASLARLWPVLSPLELFIKNYSKYTIGSNFEALRFWSSANLRGLLFNNPF